MVCSYYKGIKIKIEMNSTSKTTSELKISTINCHIKRACSANQSACFHPIKNVYRDKNALLLCHLSKVIKIACYFCQILKLFLIIVVLITVL
jgi:hypothetical protein